MQNTSTRRSLMLYSDVCPIFSNGRGSMRIMFLVTFVICITAFNMQYIQVCCVLLIQLGGCARYARQQCTSQYHLSRYALDRRFAPGMNAAASTSHVSCHVSDEIARVGPGPPAMWYTHRCGTRTQAGRQAGRQAETTSKLIIGY